MDSAKRTKRRRDAASFREWKYVSGERPGMELYKFLAPDKNCGNLKGVLMPDTIVYATDPNEKPLWLFTDREGIVQAKTRFSAEKVIKVLGSERFPKDLAAVIKQPLYISAGKSRFFFHGNETSLLNTEELMERISILSNHRGKLATAFGVVQRYIKSKGKSAFVWRVVWRSKGVPMAFVVSNTLSFEGYSHNRQSEDPAAMKLHFCTSPKESAACNVVVIHGRSVGEPALLCRKVAAYIEKRLARSLEEMTVDFIKDDDDRWWMLQIKSYKSVHSETARRPVSKLKKAQNRFVRKCAVCCRQFKRSMLQHQLSSKMIIFLLAHLKESIDGARFATVEGDPFRRGLNFAAHHGVCATCYALYGETHRLWKAEEDLAGLLEGEAGAEETVSRKHALADAMKEKLHRGKPAKLHPFKDMLCRFMIAVHSAQISSDVRKCYTVRARILGKTSSFSFSSPCANQNESQVHRVRQMRVIPFFVRIGSREARSFRFEKNIRETIVGIVDHMEVDMHAMSYIWHEELDSFYDESIGLEKNPSGVFLGSAKLDIRQFRSPRVETLTTFVPIGTGSRVVEIKITVGIQVVGRSYDGFATMERFAKNIFVPGQRFHTPDPLPLDWLDALKTKEKE